MQEATRTNSNKNYLPGSNLIFGLILTQLVFEIDSTLSFVTNNLFNIMLLVICHGGS